MIVFASLKSRDYAFYSGDWLSVFLRGNLLHTHVRSFWDSGGIYIVFRSIVL